MKTTLGELAGGCNGDSWERVERGRRETPRQRATSSIVHFTPPPGQLNGAQAAATQFEPSIEPVAISGRLSDRRWRQVRVLPSRSRLGHCFVEAVEAEDLHQTSLTSDSALSSHMTIEIHFEHLAGRHRPHLLYLILGFEAGLTEIG